ncbi:MAG: AI-2E family transporter [Ferruginibacter sp.]
MSRGFNFKLKQVVFLVLLLLLVGVTINELYAYLPGLLGAVALYILSRENYFQLIYKKKWKKGWAGMIFVVLYALLLGLPIFLAVTLISPKINALLNDPSATIASIKNVLTVIEQKTRFNIFSEQSINNAAGKITAMLPSLFNSTANILANLVLMLFLLYYMLYSGTLMEKTLSRMIPLKDENIKLLASETKITIRSNAIGIPLISLIQGATAALGYLIFGVKDVMLWGFLTGIFSFFPVIGSMIIWVPLCIYLYAIGQNGTATGLVLYSAIVTSNIDYFARITIMKRMGDVHPVITMLGIIVGLKLFGFIGLIFGPLLINYIVVLLQIYVNEFAHNPPPELQNITNKEMGDVKKPD